MLFRSKAETTAVFEILARQEEKHIDAVKLECFKLGFMVPESAPLNEDNGVSLELDELADEMTYIEALRLGIQKERAAFRLYAELLAMAEDADSQKMFLDLAEEEMRHVLQLEREVEAMIYPRKG